MPWPGKEGAGRLVLPAPSPPRLPGEAPATGVGSSQQAQGGFEADSCFNVSLTFFLCDGSL